MTASWQLALLVGFVSVLHEEHEDEEERKHREGEHWVRDVAEFEEEYLRTARSRGRARYCASGKHLQHMVIDSETGTNHTQRYRIHRYRDVIASESDSKENDLRVEKYPLPPTQVARWQTEYL